MKKLGSLSVLLYIILSTGVVTIIGCHVFLGSTLPPMWLWITLISVKTVAMLYTINTILSTPKKTHDDEED